MYKEWSKYVFNLFQHIPLSYTSLYIFLISKTSQVCAIFQYLCCIASYILKTLLCSTFWERHYKQKEIIFLLQKGCGLLNHLEDRIQPEMDCCITWNRLWVQCLGEEPDQRILQSQNSPLLHCLIPTILEELLDARLRIRTTWPIYPKWGLGSRNLERYILEPTLPMLFKVNKLASQCVSSNENIWCQHCLVTSQSTQTSHRLHIHQTMRKSVTCVLVGVDKEKVDELQRRNVSRSHWMLNWVWRNKELTQSISMFFRLPKDW